MIADSDWRPAWQPPAAARWWPDLRSAVVELVLANGYAGLDLDELAARAGIERAELDRHFTSGADCCLKVYEANLADFDRVVFAAYRSGDSWREGLRAAGYAAFRYLRDHATVVMFGELQMRDGSELARARRNAYLQRIVDLIDAGRGELDDPDSIGRNAAEGVLGAIYGQLIRTFRDDTDIQSAESLVPELMYIAVRPYLGHDVAREELSIPPPPRRDAVTGTP